MPRFAYTARDPAGQSVSAVLEASTRKEALRLLAVRGLTPLRLSESADAGKRIPETGKKAAAADTYPASGIRIQNRRRAWAARSACRSSRRSPI